MQPLNSADQPITKYTKNTNLAPKMKIWCQNVNGKHSESISAFADEAMQEKVDILLLVEVDNLSAQEREEKRNRRAENSTVARAAHENLAGSEGLCGSRNRNQRNCSYSQYILSKQTKRTCEIQSGPYMQEILMQ